MPVRKRSVLLCSVALAAATLVAGFGTAVAIAHWSVPGYVPVGDGSLFKEVPRVYGPYAVGAASLAVSTLVLAALALRVHRQSRWQPVGAVLAAVLVIALVVAAALLTIPAPVH